MSRRDINAALLDANPVSRAAVEAPAWAVGDELIAVIVAEPREASSAGSRPTARRASRVLAAGVASLALGGTAMAATGVWDPAIGSDATDSSPPTISAAPVSSAMTDALGVLRRAPGVEDRGPEVEATLATLGRSFDQGSLGRSYVKGVRPESVRYLGPGIEGGATILFSSEAAWQTFMDSTERPESAPHTDLGDGDRVCVFRPQGSGPASPGVVQGVPMCFDLDAVLAGNAVWLDESFDDPYGEEFDDPNGEAWGLVPDGVAAVTAKFPNGAEREIAVADNYFQFSWSNVEEALSSEGLEPGSAIVPAEIIWHDASGAVVPQQPSEEG